MNAMSIALYGCIPSLAAWWSGSESIACITSKSLLFGRAFVSTPRVVIEKD